MGETEKWLVRAANGDQESLRRLYGRYLPRVRRVVQGFAELSADDQEDAVQLTFIRAFAHFGRIRDQHAFERWLLAIARNEALGTLRRHSRLRRTLAFWRAGVSERQEEFPPALQQELDADVVRAVIDELPEGPEKQTAQLYYLEGAASASELAIREGVTKSAITMRLERFRGRIKAELLRRLWSVDRR